MQIKSKGYIYGLFQPQRTVLEIVLIFTPLAGIFMILPFLALIGLINYVNQCR